jgi:hypothetical protein
MVIVSQPDDDVVGVFEGALKAGGFTSFIFTDVLPVFISFTVFVILVTTSSIYRL